MLKYEDIRKMEFYPLGIQAVTFELTREFFNYDKQRFREIGKFVSKVSLILRLFTKYFVSAEKVIKEIPEMWRKNYTTGELKIMDYKESDNHVVLRLENFRLHLFHGQVLVGYFHTVTGMLGGRGTVEIKETKSPFLGDEYYEFFLKWPPIS